MSTSYPPLKFNLSEFLTIHRYRDAVEAIMWAMLTLPIMIITLNGGWIEGLNHNNPEQMLKLISRASGLYATNLILIQLIAISRNPFLNYLYGHDKLTAFHKKLGKPAYFFLTAHFFAVIMEYVIKENKTFAEEFIALFKYDQLAWAVIAFFIITLIIFTSLNTIRKHLPYEIWYYTHILVYIAIIISFPHQVNMGTDFKNHWLPLGYWWGLYITAISFIIIFRFAKPLYTSIKHQLVVTDIIQETPNVVSIYMKGKKLNQLEQNAGQFYMWKFLTPKTFLQTNPFSISTAPNSKYLRVTISNLGKGTKNLQKIRKGTKVMVDGPYGIFTKNRRLFKHVTLIAAGVGITPVRSLIEELTADEGDITVIYRGNYEADMPFIDELQQFVKTKGIKLHLSIGERGFQSSWLSRADSPKNNTEDLLRIAPNVTVSDIYICGPTAWTKSVEKTLLNAGVSKPQIHTEEFAW